MNSSSSDGNSSINARNTSAPLGINITVILVLACIIIVGILGNILVCVAVLKTRTLRVVGNYYIVSLAVSDLLLSAVVLPFAVSLEVSEGTWYFGDIFCGMWVSSDVFCCTASILNLCAISIDRFRAVTSPLKYSVKRTPCMAKVNIAIVWSVSAILSFPAAIALKANNKLPTRGCVLSDDPYYIMISSCISFYFPCCVMIVLYYKIFRTAQLRARNVVVPAVAVIHVQPANIDFEDEENKHGQGAAGRRNTDEDIRRNERDRISTAKERKAARTLAIVMGAFIVSWLPFFTVNVIIGACSTCTLADQLFSVVTWLGWCNSAVNPIIYTVFNKEFRNAFKRILTGSRVNVA